jgi:8-oxo-dGTP diphosphatase
VPRPGVYAIIDAGDGLLATFQEEPRPELLLPGGGIDPGESPRVALSREVMEETGYAIHSLRRLGMFHRFTYMPEYDLHAQKQCHIYVARLGPQRSEPTEPGHSAVFLPWQTALEKLAVSGDRHFVARWLRLRR